VWLTFVRAYSIDELFLKYRRKDTSLSKSASTSIASLQLVHQQYFIPNWYSIIRYEWNLRLDPAGLFHRIYVQLAELVASSLVKAESVQVVVGLRLLGTHIEQYFACAGSAFYPFVCTCCVFQRKMLSNFNIQASRSQILQYVLCCTLE